MRWIVIVGLALSVLIAGGGGTRADSEETLELDVLALGKTVYMLRSNTKIGNPTTVISVGEDGVFLVDPNLDRVATTLLPAIAELGGGAVRYATASHYHGDHTENFELLAREVPAATLFVPHDQRRRLAEADVVHGERPMLPEALPVLTFDGRLRLRFNGETIDIETLPAKRGHTDGDAIVYFHEANVLYPGDYFFLDRFPMVDESGDLEGFLANIAYMVETYPADCTVVPGHGRFHPEPIAAADMATLRRYHEQLRESIAVVRRRMASGRTADEIVAEGLPEKFASFGERPRYVSEERWVRFVVDYYGSKR